MTITIRPVRAIKRETRANPILVTNAINAVLGGDAFHRMPRHQSVDRMLGSLSKPQLERVLARVSN